MNVTLVILGILLIVLIYVIYQYVTNVSQEISDYKNVTTSATSVTPEDLSSPNSTRYAHSIWVYVKKHSGECPFITFSDATGTAGTKLYLAANTPTLKYASSAATSAELIITDNFPIQKWVCLTISIDNQIVDVYMDGKLVKSAKYTHGTPSTWTLSSGSFEGYITKFKRWAEPLNPQKVYDIYMEGNGRSGILPAYGVDLSLFKDNIEQSKFTLF
jgi:hypothetical protein